ncbi:lipopolysaccharide biosynthesis protein [Parahaliea mediterranea]|uniref:Lipopolysaccharide biosynthesis protein n=1 Tax=Parahaliea mediterranea TaxID=651086 RepID=A0A939DFW9_9GAMM|nr:lipopolysaccharide biosynthesis protein [Parahaliea mediterranea]MBN7797436.1 lipopolysaccharide biosynthesis protein [Parahaliea mediterranea]
MTDGIYKHLARGAAWSIGMKWTMRLIGMVNIVILARLLTPADFGIVAMAMVAIAFVQSFTELGPDQLLIRDTDPDTDHINSAWTIKILQGALVALLLLAVAPFAAAYFGDPRLVGVLYVLALAPLIDGTSNIGITLARKQLNFQLDFWAEVVTRIITFIVTLALVLWLRSYWALIIGHVLNSVAYVLVSFLLHPWRPRICFAYFRRYLAFAGYILPIRIAKFFNGRMGTIIVGGMGNAGLLGIYKMAADLAEMVTGQIATPLSRGLFPGYARLSNDPPALATAFRNVLAASAMVMFPIATGLAAVAQDFVPLLLGDQWLATIPLMSWLCLYAMFSAINRLMTTHILIVAGKERHSALVAWFRLAILFPAAYLASREYGVIGVAIACAGVSVFMLPVSGWVLSRAIPLGFGGVLAVLARPAIASMAMYWCVAHWLVAVLEPGLFRLVAGVVLGVGIYAVIILLGWVSAGRPSGVESLLLAATRKYARLGSGQSGS